MNGIALLRILNLSHNIEKLADLVLYNLYGSNSAELCSHKRTLSLAYIELDIHRVHYNSDTAVLK